MARIDSILSIVLRQGANELRVGADREPKMLANGTPKRLSIPKTSEMTLRELLGDILSPERDELLRAGGRLELTYEAAGLGSFSVTLTRQDEGGPAATFVLAGTRVASPQATPVAPLPQRQPLDERKPPVDQSSEQALPSPLTALV